MGKFFSKTRVSCLNTAPVNKIIGYIYYLYSDKALLQARSFNNFQNLTFNKVAI
jgi:hypothetical protein